LRTKEEIINILAISVYFCIAVCQRVDGDRNPALAPAWSIVKYRLRYRLAFLCLLLILPQMSWAVGTLAGTMVSNVASVNYTVGAGAAFSVKSNTVLLQVDEVIAPVLTWQDALPVAVTTPGSNGVLTYLLTNVGNGSESFGLTRVNGPTPLPDGNYTPLNGSLGAIYLESGATPGFQATGPNADLLYLPGSNDPQLAADASVILYVISNTPSVGSNVHGDVLLRAASMTTGAAGALPGTALPGLGQGGGFAVVGSSRAQSSATGTYITSGLGFAMNKTVLKVTDPQGGGVAMPGSILTYQIVATLAGTGTATGLVITDPMPVNTTYVPGSMAVNGLAQTDAADADLAQWVGSTQTVTLALGNVAAPATFVIVFRATIQ
jgi:uncharacterized repeat protein (TIGR01451 family)